MAYTVKKTLIAGTQTALAMFVKDCLKLQAVIFQVTLSVQAVAQIAPLQCMIDVLVSHARLTTNVKVITAKVLSVAILLFRQVKPLLP